MLAVTGPAGTIELPLQVTEMPDRVVWLPLNSTGSGVAADTGARPGALVRIGPAAAPASPRRHGGDVMTPIEAPQALTPLAGGPLDVRHATPGGWSPSRRCSASPS